MVDVMSTTVFADHKEPIMREPTRFEYLEKWIPTWLATIEYPAYIMVSALIGARFLLEVPLISVAAFFAAAYFYEQLKLKKIMAFSKTRHVLMGL
jgi:hypothetical protein